MKTNTKMIAASLSLITSFSAVAGIGGVHVQSNLGEPFSGSIVVTGQEAKAVLQNGASVSVAVKADAGLPENVVHLPLHTENAALGALMDTIELAGA